MLITAPRGSGNSDKITLKLIQKNCSDLQNASYQLELCTAGSCLGNEIKNKQNMLEINTPIKTITIKINMNKCKT